MTHAVIKLGLICLISTASMAKNNDVTVDDLAILYAAHGFKRNAAAVIEHRDVDWIDLSRIVDENKEERINIPEVVEKWVETLCESLLVQSVIGNHERKRLLLKPAERAIKSLFKGDL